MFGVQLTPHFANHSSAFRVQVRSPYPIRASSCPRVGPSLPSIPREADRECHHQGRPERGSFRSGNRLAVAYGFTPRSLRVSPLARNRKFESISLQGRVQCEPDFPRSRFRRRPEPKGRNAFSCASIKVSCGRANLFREIPGAHTARRSFSLDATGAAGAIPRSVCQDRPLRAMNSGNASSALAPLTTCVALPAHGSSSRPSARQKGFHVNCSRLTFLSVIVCILAKGSGDCDITRIP
jgi:hypothetical protein